MTKSVFLPYILLYESFNEFFAIIIGFYGKLKILVGKDGDLTPRLPAMSEYLYS